MMLSQVSKLFCSVKAEILTKSTGTNVTNFIDKHDFYYLSLDITQLVCTVHIYVDSKDKTYYITQVNCSWENDQEWWETAKWWQLKKNIVIPTNKKIKHIRNVDKQGYSETEYGITKI